MSQFSSNAAMRHQFRLVNALVNRITIFIYFVLFASDALGHYCGCFVGDEAIYYGVRIGNEVEAVNGELI
jgi:hypothetical protein